MPTTKQDIEKLTQLGHTAQPERRIEAFPNHAPGEIEVVLHCGEFTCVCPSTGQPDYARLEIKYRPDQSVIESKSMKLYLETFRNEGIFHEHLAVDVGKDIVRFVDPLSVDVTVHFNARGGIAISATWHYERPRERASVLG